MGDLLVEALDEQGCGHRSSSYRGAQMLLVAHRRDSRPLYIARP
jgi:hypothetical protein